MRRTTIATTTRRAPGRIPIRFSPITAPNKAKTAIQIARLGHLNGPKYTRQGYMSRPGLTKTDLALPRRVLGVGVGPGRGAGLSPGPSPRPALRTGYSTAVAEHDAFDSLIKQFEGNPLPELGGLHPAAALVSSLMPEMQLERHGPETCGKQRKPDVPLQRATLALVLQEDPAKLTLIELADKLFDRFDPPEAGAPLAQAVRDLAASGLLKRRGPLVLPTRAALQVKRLELCR